MAVSLEVVGGKLRPSVALRLHREPSIMNIRRATSGRSFLDAAGLFGVVSSAIG